MRMDKLRLSLLALIIIYGELRANTVHTIESYIQKYDDIAVREMNRSGIPASITLSQGILESSYGNSPLAVDAKNHFGIKCHNEWEGYTFWQYDDEEKPSCFRSYCSPEKSYIDHTNFLLTRSRYDFLFKLDKTDYKAWAKGLQKAGYATASGYADKLISLIDRYELYTYDYDDAMSVVSFIEKPVSPKPLWNDAVWTSNIVTPETELEYTIHDTQEIFIEKTILTNTMTTGKATSELFPKHFRKGIFTNNNVKMVIASAQDTPESIARAQGIPLDNLMAYNDLEPKQTLLLHQYVYLQPKQSKFRGIRGTHRIKHEESMYIIAQVYGLQLDVLLMRNRMKKGDEPALGEIIYLRGSADIPPKLRKRH